MPVYRVRRLGDIPVTRAAYVSWASGVKQNGGVVVTLPHYPGNIPAARYPIERVFPYAPDTTLGAGFSRMPDDWSTDGAFVYYAAPDDAVGYAASTMLQAQTVPGEPAPANPKWYDDFLNSLKGVGREVLIGVGVTLAVAYVIKRKR